MKITCSCGASIEGSEVPFYASDFLKAHAICREKAQREPDAIVTVQRLGMEEYVDIIWVRKAGFVGTKIFNCYEVTGE